MLAQLWNDVKGNFKWDVIKAIVAICGIGGLISGALAAVLRWWLVLPNTIKLFLAVWAVSVTILTLLWRLNARLIALTPRLEFVSQRSDGTGYKKPGNDTAIVIPFLNRSRWWHAALPESLGVAAHIEFFDEAGSQIEATYPAMWLNEPYCRISFPIGEVKELILALTGEPIRPFSEWRVPECHTQSGKVKDVIQAHERGEMLSLKFLTNKSATLTAAVHVVARGYAYKRHYKVYCEANEPGAEVTNWPM